MKKLNLFLIFLIVSVKIGWAGEQLDFYNSDKKNGWDLYVEGNKFYLSGDQDKAIQKWKEAVAKSNLHAAARLLQEDLQSQKKDYATLYEPLLKNNFSIGRYLSLRYLGGEDQTKAEVQKKEVIKTMLELEDTEDYWANSIIGNFYTDNSEKKDEFLLGIRFLLKSAEGGYSPAQDKLGTLYWTGNDKFNKDRKKAIDWLEKAAKTKDKFACLHLAQIYHKGNDDIPPDIPKSIPYYEEAARQGLNDAILNLGLIYEEGQTIAKNAEKNHQYLTQLLDCQDLEIYRFLGARYFYTNEEWKDKTKGLLWYEKASEIGNLSDKYKFADLLYSDKDVLNYEKARVLFLKLVPKDDVIKEQFQILVYLRLGAIYYNGFGVKQNYLESKKYYEKVSHTSEALEAIIAMYLNGWGVKQSDDMVLFYITKLMDPTRAKGFVPGPYFEILGNIYKKRQDLVKCLENYRLAAISGQETAMKELKEIYTPLDVERIGDLGDISFALLKFEEADVYYQKEENKNYARSLYNRIRLLDIEKYKKFNHNKSITEMKSFVEGKIDEYPEKIDHALTDRVIDPELVGVPYKARGYFWLALHTKKQKETNENKNKVVEESAEFFLLAEKNGCTFAGINAAVAFLKSETPSHWEKGKEILERLYKDKNPFAAAFLGGIQSISKYGKIDLQKTKEYQKEAMAWDKSNYWSSMSVDTLIHKGVMQLLMPSK